MRQGRQLASEDELYLAALGALARRAHSVAEMRRYLEGRAAARELARPVLARLKAEGMLDDARYARQFARARAANRRQGRFRIARELRSRGVPDRHIQAALAELAGQVDEPALLRRRAEQWLVRHRIADPAALEPNRRAALYRSLLRAGFPAEGIRAELRRLGQTDEALPEPTEAEDN